MSRREKNIKESIKFYSEKLEKELGYSEDLQDVEVIARYKVNLEKLAKM